MKKDGITYKVLGDAMLNKSEHGAQKNYQSITMDYLVI